LFFSLGIPVMLCVIRSRSLLILSIRSRSDSISPFAERQFSSCSIVNGNPPTVFSSFSLLSFSYRTPLRCILANVPLSGCTHKTSLRWLPQGFGGKNTCYNALVMAWSQRLGIFESF
jgi:hypothetical protein